MKHILYISLLLFTYSCKSKKTEEAPLNKLWKMGIDTVALPDNNLVLQPPYGDEELIDTGWVTYTGKRLSVGHNTTSLKSGIKKHHKKRDWASIIIGDSKTKDGGKIGFGYDTSDTATLRAGDSISASFGRVMYLIDGALPKPVYDTLKTIVSYVDTSVEARPNVIDWKYLYYVRRTDVLFSRDNYYLDLDKKPIKSSIVVLEARILDPK